jgi:translation initiation factor IF-1
MPADTDVIDEGRVIDVLPGKFKVETSVGAIVLAHLSGKMRQNSIRVVLGDRVKIAMSPYDLTKGRILERLRE